MLFYLFAVRVPKISNVFFLFPLFSKVYELSVMQWRPHVGATNDGHPTGLQTLECPSPIKGLGHTPCQKSMGRVKYVFDPF